ncbi:MAG: DUF7379 domain-containing protein, partial [Candidatus Binatia bacterium]
MYWIYDGRSSIERISGRVSGGSTVITDNPDDLYALQALCVESKELELFYHRVQEFDSWSKWFQDKRKELQAATQKEFETMANKRFADLSEVERLMISLALAQNLWTITPEPDRDALIAMVSISMNGSEMVYKAEEPALFFHEGSLVTTITPFVPRIGLFVLGIGAYGVAIVRKAGILSPIHAEKLVEDLRDARKPTAQFPDLPRLDGLDRKLLQGKKGVIVLLHGLFSTDLGTFDGFIERWKEPPKIDGFLELKRLRLLWRERFPDREKQPDEPSEEDFSNAFRAALENDYLIVGWPHDTLTRIRVNADSLFENVHTKLGLDSPPIALLCHSRGGLVARKTAVIMHRKGGDWAGKVRLCVTFGTPHKGADLA